MILSFADTFASPITEALQPRQFWGYVIGSEQATALLLVGVFAVIACAIALCLRTHRSVRGLG